VALLWAVLVRPEGALLAVLFILIELIVERRPPVFSLASAVIALVFSLPYVGFKLAYYGTILPNSFYAKTVFGLEQVTAGLDYAGRFFGHYPHFAAALVLVALLWRRLSGESRAVWLFALGYVLYVVLIGGDVLKVHRFFLPILSALAVVVTILVSEATNRFRDWIQACTLIFATILLTAAGLFLPRSFIYRYAQLEKGLTDKMGFIAASLRDIDDTDFTVASATIGRLGYGLRGHRLIDLLGLTDTTIARHPESIPEGMESTWRERAFNSRYVLEQAPDYIVFATGLKPSAPAERALLRYEQFLSCYRTAAFYYEPGGVRLETPLVSVFRRKCEPSPPFEPAYSIEFVNYYNRGTNAFSSGRFDEADQYLNAALQLGGDPPYVYLLYRLAMNSFRLGRIEQGEALQSEIVRLDSTVAEVQADLYVYEYTVGNREKAAVHRRWLESLWPWMTPRFDSVAQARARQWQARQSGQR
jgi:tetratricopeptide (TPR) repeat protein